LETLAYFLLGLVSS
jgi:hypothetical protein